MAKFLGGCMSRNTNEKYIWYYLSVYIFVLIVYASFDYFISCSGNSLECKVDWSNVKDILQTTAYMLTPIVAIIGFYAWKEETKYSKRLDLLLQIREELRLTSEAIFRLRNYHCLDHETILLADKDSVKNKYNEYFKYANDLYFKIEKIKNIFNDVYFVSDVDESIQHTIQKHLNTLKSVIIQSQKMHKKIYYQFKNDKILALNSDQEKKLMAYYDALYDGVEIKEKGEEVTINVEMDIAEANNKLYFIIMEINEKGSTGKLTLKQRILLRH